MGGTSEGDSNGWVDDRSKRVEMSFVLLRLSSPMELLSVSRQGRTTMFPSDIGKVPNMTRLD